MLIHQKRASKALDLNTPHLRNTEEQKLIRVLYLGALFLSHWPAFYPVETLRKVFWGKKKGKILSPLEEESTVYDLKCGECPVAYIKLVECTAERLRTVRNNVPEESLLLHIFWLLVRVESLARLKVLELFQAEK